MYMVLTNAGVAALQSNPLVPPTLTAFKLGSASNYPPSASDSNIHGSVVFTGTPSAPIVIDTNQLRYTLLIDASAGPFTYGEIGLFLPGNVLFALGSFSVEQTKTPVSNSSNGNSYRIDCFISSVGTNYSIFADVGNSDKVMRLPTLPSVDLLPIPTATAELDTSYNAYVCNTPVSTYSSVLAVSIGGLWTLVGYDSVRAVGSVLGASGQTLTLSATPGVLTYTGELVLGIISGALRGAVRMVQATDAGAFTVTISTPFSTLPLIGTQVVLYQRRMLNPLAEQLLGGLSATLSSADLNQLDNFNVADAVKRDGSVALTGDLNLGQHRAINVSNPSLPQDAANKLYVDAQIASVSTAVSAINNSATTLNAVALKRDGSVIPTADLDLGNYRLRNVGNPVESKDAVNLSYFNAFATSLQSAVNPPHNNLPGLQGGTSVERYHLNATEYSIINGIASKGFPTATTSTGGIIALSDTLSTANAQNFTTAIAPRTLKLAIEALDDAYANPLQAAFLSGHRKPVLSSIFTSNVPVAIPSVGQDLVIFSLVDSAGGNWTGYPSSVLRAGFGVPLSGWYRVNLTIRTGDSAGTSAATFGWKKNGVPVGIFQDIRLQTGGSYTGTQSIMVKMNAAEVLSIYIYSSSGTFPTLNTWSALDFEWLRPLA